MAKPIAKITVRCPHCAAEQQEPEQAKSTFCRRCSQYFAITSAALASAAPAAKTLSPDAKPRPSYLNSEPESADKTAGSGGLFTRFEGLLSSKPKQRLARCFECSSSHEVSSSATSTTCKACGAYIDLQDYKVSTSFSRNIKTRGAVYLSSKGDLSSSKIICGEATLHGKMRGNLICDGLVTIRSLGKIPGSIEAGDLVIEKGSDIQFSRPIRAVTVAVHGTMSGEILSDSHVVISKSGSLDGNVTATGFSVEKGGIFQGELTITPRQTSGRSAAGEASEGTGGISMSGRMGSPLNASLLGGEQNPAHP